MKKKKIKKTKDKKKLLKKAASKSKIKAAAKKKAVLYTGTFSATRSGYGFVIPDEKYKGRFSGDVFIPAKYVFDTVDSDRVAFRLSGGGDEGIIKEVISRGVTEFTGTFRIITRSVYGRRETKRIVIADSRKLCFDTFVSEKNTLGAADGDKVLCSITEYPDTTESKPARGRITAVFGSGDTLKANEEALLASHHARIAFPPDVLAEAAAVRSNPITKRGRLDLTDKLIFTIDGASAKDLDDAISVEREGENYILGVHIADVSSYVKENSQTDKEALLRGTSVYYADKVIPMLPAELSNGVCSLNPGVNRRTLSVFMTIDRNGETVKSEISESVINSKVRGVYSEVNDVIDKGENSAFYGKYACVFKNGGLNTLLALYGVLAEKSKRRGALELETPEPVFVIEDGMTKDVTQAQRGISERVIEQFMIAANEAVAKTMKERGLPCIYRTHDEPDEEKIQKLLLSARNAGLDIKHIKRKKIKPSDLSALLTQAEEKGCAEAFSYLILRSMMKAKYESEPSPHFGIGSENYCHFTSPIRRYPDLFVHRAVKALLVKNGTDKVKRGLVFLAHTSAQRSNDCEQAALLLERDMEDLYRADYMSRRIDEEYDGTVSSVLPGGIFVRLENTCEGYISFENRRAYRYDGEKATITSNGKVYSVGVRLRVKTVAADIKTRRVDFEEIKDSRK